MGRIRKLTTLHPLIPIPLIPSSPAQRLPDAPSFQKAEVLYREFVETRPPEVLANIAICLIHQANYLLDQQLRRLEKDFLEQGGLRERMFEARLAWRNGNGG